MKSDRLTLMIVLFGSSLWGIYWMPIHLLEAVGFKGPMAALILSAAGLPFVMLYLGFAKRGSVDGFSWFAAFIMGAGVGLWGASIAFTDVIRALLLFYLLPVWTTGIECLFMGRKFHIKSVIAIACSLAGILVISRGDFPIAGLGALGDWMALAGGFMFAVGMAIVFRADKPYIPKIMLGSLIGSVVAGWIAVVYLQAHAEPVVVTSSSWLIALVLGLVYTAPLLFITLWGTTNVSPATLSFIMTAEVIVGVATSALFLDELFGFPEVIGAALIITGATLEVWGSKLGRIRADA